MLLGPALLFCPGNRPDRFEKALAAADQVVLDLEDGVAADDKGSARDAVVAFLGRRADRVVVRINRPLSEHGRADAAAVIAAGARVLLLPKTEMTAEIEALRDIPHDGPPPQLIATVETARGALALGSILACPGVAAVSWGPYDLAADLGLKAVRGEDGRYLGPLEQIRNLILVHAAAACVPMLDTVTSELSNDRLLRRDADEAALLGLGGKFIIHPSQAAAIRAAFRPNEAEVARSRRMLAAVEGQAVLVFEGEMIDEPMLRRARRILAMSEPSPADAP
jgi:citrate lyase subunit beta/citryl-CoA lyase